MSIKDSFFFEVRLADVFAVWWVATGINAPGDVPKVPGGPPTVEVRGAARGRRDPIRFPGVFNPDAFPSGYYGTVAGVVG